MPGLNFFMTRWLMWKSSLKAFPRDQHTKSGPNDLLFPVPFLRVDRDLHGYEPVPCKEQIQPNSGLFDCLLSSGGLWRGTVPCHEFRSISRQEAFAILCRKEVPRHSIKSRGSSVDLYPVSYLPVQEDCFCISSGPARFHPGKASVFVL